MRSIADGGNKAAWRNPRVLATLLGGLVIVALAIVMISVVVVDQSAAALEGRVIWPLALLMVLAYAGTLFRVVRQSYRSMWQDLTDPPGVEEPFLLCAGCGRRFPSRFYFDDVSRHICLECAAERDNHERRPAAEQGDAADKRRL